MPSNQPTISDELLSQVESLQESSLSTVDLTSGDDLDAVVNTAENLLAITAEKDELRALTDPSLKFPLGLAVAAKLALSKAIVAEIEKQSRGPALISVLFAAYAEHQRILSPEQHPHGEDFLRRKVKQLRWLFDSYPSLDWEMIMIDDGCPEGTGKIAESIILEEELGDQVRVRFLQEAIEKSLPGAGDLQSTSDSQKGGAILYGMWDALESAPNLGEIGSHIVLYTDADLSTHLGQIGLLLEPLLLDESPAVAAIGSRREPDSVVVKTGTRNTRGKLFIYLWKQLVSVLPNVIDTQCAFKAFPDDVAREIITPAIEKKFAFDIELLIKTALLEGGEIATVPLAWIDSEAASTTTDLEPYLPMLRAIVKMYREYLPSAEDSAPFASFIESLDEDSWARLTEIVPEEIAEREPFELGSSALVSADQLRQIAAS